VLSDLGEVGADYAEMAVVHTPENAQAFLKYAHPGLAAADHHALERISEHYALLVEPEDASPSPFIQPSLFITARQDQVVGYDDSWARIEHYPRATFVVLDSAGHNAHLDRSVAANALIADWLDRMVTS
jgi:pimeloyl-ACP methyl ester carboxylesterase